MSSVSPVSILYDGAGNPVGVVLDGSVYRLQVAAQVTESVLPTGAATAALQTQPGVDIGDVTVNNAAGASAVNIQDGGNSITVDAASLPLPAGAATETTLAAVNAKLGTIGQQVMAASAPVTIASDQSAVETVNTLQLPSALSSDRLKVEAQIVYGAGEQSPNVSTEGNQRLMDVRDEEQLHVLREIRDLLQVLVLHAEIVTNEEELIDA
jgi:hypothetical protein